MADVYGRIGNEEVELNNAATEATLKALLAATATSNIEQLATLRTLANKSGVAKSTTDEALGQIKNVGSASSQTTVGMKLLGDAVDNAWQATKQTYRQVEALGAKMADGTAKTSDVFDALAKLPGPLGAVAELFGKIASFQETNLDTYQKISASGVNFSGSLDDMRIAQAKSYLTLEQFTSTIQNNQEAFARIGGNVNDGATAFFNFSNSFIKSDFGQNLRALGYTFQELTDNELTYMQIRGGVSKAELASKDAMYAVAEGTHAYIQEQAILTELTGKNRKQLEDEQKKIAQQEAFQAHLTQLRLTGESERAQADKELALVRSQTSQYGEEAGLNMMALTMNLAPVTKGLQLFAGVNASFYAEQRRQAALARDRNISEAELLKQSHAAGYYLAETAKNMGENAFYQSLANTELAPAVNAGLKQQVIALNNNLTAHEHWLDRGGEIADKNDKAASSQAAAAAKTQQKMNEANQEVVKSLVLLNEKIEPTFNSLFQAIQERFVKALDDATPKIAAAIDWVFQHGQALKHLTEEVGLAYLAWKAFKIASAVKSAGGGLGGLANAALERGTFANPMWVAIREGFKPGGGVPTPEGGGGGSSENKPKSRFNKGRLGSVGIGSALGIYGGYEESNAIEEARKQKQIDDAEAARQQNRNRVGTGLEVGLYTAAALLAPETFGLSLLLPLLAGPLGRIIGETAYDQFDPAKVKTPEGKASGGPINPGSYLVGEKGPEIISTNSSGNVITNENLTAMIESSIGQKAIGESLKQLNIIMNDIRSLMRETVDNTDRQISELKNLSGNQMPH